MADESSSSLSSSIQSGQANLDECYRNFRESKITRENVWTNPFIDQFQHLVGRHHSALRSFHLVGSMIEASSQIYGLKVDCVHSDVLRLASGVRRENIIQPIAGTVDESIASVSSNQSFVPIKRRRVKTTVVGNSQLINAKLQTTEEHNCLFKSKGVNPENTPTKNLLQRVLPSDKYSLSLQSKNKFWINRAAQVNELDDADNSAVVNADSVDLPVLNWAPSNTDVVRSTMTGYAISNTPTDDFQYPSTTIVDDINQFDVEDNYNEMSHHSSIDLQFDINGDAERSQQPIRMQPGILDDSLNTAEDLNALQRCSVLQQNGSITDLRPVTLTPLEYSYRRISSSQVLSGSNHWKFPSMQSNNSKGNKKRRKRKLAVKDKPVALRSVLKESIAEKFVSVDDRLAQSIRKVCYTKWQSNKLTVPSRMCMPSLQSFSPLVADCIQTYNVSLANENVIDMDVDEENEVIDGNGNDDSISLGDNINVNPHDSYEMDVAGYVHEDVNDLPPVSSVPVKQLQPMQISPSNLDAKKITKKCLEIICAYEAEGGEVSFSHVYHQLQNNNQDVTPAVVFSCILQLANENNFILNKIGANDFVVKRI